MTELLIDTPLTAEQRHFATTVYQSGEVLLEIINNILDFSKIEAGKLELDVTDFDMRQVVEDVTTLLAERAHCRVWRSCAFTPNSDELAGQRD